MNKCVEHEQVEVEHVPGNEQRADILSKSLGRIKLKEMRAMIGVEDVSEEGLKLKGEIVGVSLKKVRGTSKPIPIWIMNFRDKDHIVFYY